MTRSYHTPQGDPCSKCGSPFLSHLVEHQPQGDPCSLCGLPSEKHRYKGPRKASRYYVGIDGEGQGRDPHRYVMLAWSAENGLRNCIEAKPNEMLTSKQCLQFILSTPANAKLFAYAFNYDLTMMLKDLPDETLYYLFRPELRQRLKVEDRKFGPKPVQWDNYQLNFIGTKFSVRSGKTLRVIWDVFRFFQAKFTTALIEWKVADAQLLESMQAMKDKRADFDKLSRDEIRAYCFEECVYMAKLARKLTDSHEKAGLKLRSYFGAGSSASAMLKKMGIDKEERRGPAKIDEHVASAFFGGRFEHSIIGTINSVVYGYDISSAYPYQIYFLPCLQCGTWKHVTNRQDIDNCTMSLVRYSLDRVDCESWAPFPFRLNTGAICFPRESGGGWLWSSEYLAGENAFPGKVNFHEAWTYTTECRHFPFRTVADYYLERLKIGKEGPGIVIKLGMNSIYGKQAQSVGIDPPFQSWIWAGMVTAGTRAQILDMMAMHSERKNLLMIATDGIYSRELLMPKQPRGTGTYTSEHKKPLGGWEGPHTDKEKYTHNGGLFAARPGIYFPMNPTEKQIKAIRARGLGRNTLFQCWERIIKAWANGDDSIKVTNVSRFFGAKTSISRTLKPPYKYTRANHPAPKPSYGQWREREVCMTFNPLPKREKIVNPDNTLRLRSFPDEVSKPYSRSLVNPEALLMRLAAMEMLEQPSGDDFSDYEIGE